MIPQALHHPARPPHQLFGRRRLSGRIAEIATARGISFAALIAEVDENRATSANLSSALRLYVLAYLRKAAAPDASDASRSPE